jgi:hypothetical protein
LLEGEDPNRRRATVVARDSLACARAATRHLGDGSTWRGLAAAHVSAPIGVSRRANATTETEAREMTPGTTPQMTKRKKTTRRNRMGRKGIPIAAEKRAMSTRGAGVSVGASESASAIECECECESESGSALANESGSETSNSKLNVRPTERRPHRSSFSPRSRPPPRSTPLAL